MFWDYERRPLSMTKLRLKSERAVKRTSKSQPARSPVRIEGRTITRSYWGKAWCQHLESFSDYSSRLGRGRSYLYAGAVLDLQLHEGRITAEVQGSRLYHQTIEVETLSARQRAELRKLAAGKIDSLVSLLRGQLPDALLAAMTDPKHGVFPTVDQIRLECSCPDWASLCKHLAAVLYGVGARLDASPELLFKLRGLPVDELLQHTEPAALTVPAIAPEKRPEGDLAALFDIDLVAALPAPPKPAPKPPVRATREHLKVLGVPARTIDAWLREGVLLKTDERNLYERTPEADRRIAELLAR